MKIEHCLPKAMLLVAFQILIAASPIESQVLDSTRSMNWTQVGLKTTPGPCVMLNIMDYGASNDGSTNTKLKLSTCFNILNGLNGMVYFPTGTYLFTTSVVLPDNIILRGAGADSTTFLFDLGGGGNCLNAAGTYSGELDTLEQSATRGAKELIVNDGSLYLPGDYVKIMMDDQDLLNDAWAAGSVAHIVQIDSIDVNTLFIDQSLRLEYPTTLFARIRKLNPRKNIGLENFKIDRQDATASQTSNIRFKRTVNSWVKGVESQDCNFSHVVIDESAYVEVSGCYLHHAFNYGGGGKAYGVALQGGSNLCLIENNIFEHLRHSMILQSGANANVLAYNYSTDPHWTEFPNDGGGDIVLHGNYPFLNLFEGNVVQNIRIDASHGINGPFNTFFRNRAELYGLIMSSSPASDSQNIIGSEITNTDFFYGNYATAGSGHFEHGNNVLNTTVPSGTSSLSDTSYAYSEQPGFLSPNPNWPLIGYPNTLDQQTIPAEMRFSNGGIITVPDSQYQIQISDLLWTACDQTNDWAEPLNWNLGRVPTLDDDVIIPTIVLGSSLFPVLSTITKIHGITIQSGARLDVTLSGFLELEQE